MDRETIKKALECCSSEVTTNLNCGSCPMGGKKDCMTLLYRNALALIKEQGEQIFNLEKRLKEQENGYEGTLYLDRCKLHDAEEKVKELTEENERLSTALANYDRQTDVRISEEYYTAEAYEVLREENERLKLDVEVCGAELSRYTENIVQMAKQDRANTVREFAERLKAKAKNNEWNGTICGEDIDQIAKEMLEDEK